MAQKKLAYVLISLLFASSSAYATRPPLEQELEKDPARVVTEEELGNLAAHPEIQKTLNSSDNNELELFLKTYSTSPNIASRWLLFLNCERARETSCRS